ncbi:bactofilin family protein [Melittangium boletus]|uniref:bactofilin family protein n=1 Tax=Melittangium boletus TaxID=83453 RepID=UPI003DA6739A
MKTARRLCLSAALLAAPLSLAQSTPDDSAQEIQLRFRGTLRDALQKIAEEGELNVVVTGALDTPTEVNFKGVSADQALRTMARAYSLHLERDGGIYTLRAMTDAEKTRAQVAPPPAPASPSAPAPPPAPSAVTPPDDFSDSVLLNEKDLKRRVHAQMKKLHQRARKGGQGMVARGHSLEVKEGESVDSAIVYGGNLVIDGQVEGDAVVYGGNLQLNGHVEGDVVVFGGNAELGPNAVVEGSVSSFGGRVTRQPGAHVEGSIESLGGASISRMVSGEIKDALKDAREEEDEEKPERGGTLASFLLRFAMLFGMGFLGQLFFPSRMKALSAEIRNEPVKSGLLGLMGAVLLVPALLILSVTIVGIPLALALALVVPVLTVWGFAAVASELGSRVPLRPASKTQALVLALGLLVLLGLGQIPYLGNVVTVLALLVSLGAVMRTRFGIRPQGMPEPIFPNERARG